MLIEGRKGRFILLKNYRDAFKLEVFEEKYIEECFDKYEYIVGDISTNILRLKGFDTNPKSKNYFGFIEDYLDLSCAMGCPHYVLKRIQSENEYRKELDHPSKVDEDGFVIHSVGKESFDKESLILDVSLKRKPNIVIDADKMNQMPKGELSADLKETVEADQTTTSNNAIKAEKPESTQSYVSSSPGFVPNQNKNQYRKNNNKKRNKK